MKKRAKQKILHLALFLTKLPIIVGGNTIRAGWSAPERWYNLIIRKKPFWAYLRKNH